MSASELRAAATKLRALAREATPGPWHAYFNIHGDPSVVTDIHRPSFTTVATVTVSPDDYGRRNATLIAAMNPTVALALVDLLDVATEDWDDDIAAQFGEHNMRWYPALTVARAINSGAS